MTSYGKLVKKNTYLSVMPQELAPCWCSRLLDFIGPVPQSLWIRYILMYPYSSTIKQISQYSKIKYMN